MDVSDSYRASLYNEMTPEERQLDAQHRAMLEAVQKRLHADEPSPPPQNKTTALAGWMRTFLSPKRCPKCLKLTEGGHERDGTDLCWCVDD